MKQDGAGRMKKYLLSFLVGSIGMLLLISGYFFVTIQYDNYILRSQTSAWFNEIGPLLEAVEREIRQKNFRNVDVKNDEDIFLGKAKHVNTLVVTDSGLVIIRGGNIGQVVVLIPSLEEENVSWRCKGGPDYAIPRICNRGIFYRE
jgi:hypothetical protein